jgi:glycosyltransferase involved in cell wall biosynthesis
MSTKSSSGKSPVRLAYIGCAYKHDLYSHNCSNIVESLRANDVEVEVVTSNCRCFSSAHRFAITEDELITGNCSAIRLPHVPANPSKRLGMPKYHAVKILRLDLWLAILRGFSYYQRSAHADVIHFDQVLEAFGAVPLFVVIGLASLMRKRVVANVHEIDPFQRTHKWLNRFYDKCSEVFVYSEHMKKELVALGARPEKIRTIRYGAAIPERRMHPRAHYIYFGGHYILKGKGYWQLLEALVILKDRTRDVSVLIHVGHGCNGLVEAQAMATQLGVAGMLKWAEFFTSDELAEAYQKSKACLIPFTGGSARHPVTCAMANGTPIVATRAVDIPEYVGNLGIYVDGSAESIAEALEQIEEGKHDLERLGASLREKAIAELDHNKVAQGLTAIYSEINSRSRLVTITPNSAA